MFITTIINAHKGHDVACFNIPGLVLHTDVNEDIIMVLKGIFRKYITVDRKRMAILYVKMQKAL